MSVAASVERSEKRSEVRSEVWSEVSSELRSEVWSGGLGPIHVALGPFIGKSGFIRVRRRVRCCRWLLRRSVVVVHVRCIPARIHSSVARRASGVAQVVLSLVNCQC